MHPSRNRAPVLIALGMSALMVFVLASSSVDAAPLAPSSTPVGVWSYGAVKNVTVGPLQSSDGWMYEGTATFGYTVTIFDNSTSSATFELTVLRTMGAAFTVRFCDPSCSSPAQWANESYRAWESTTAFANFTSQGTVLESGVSSVPAIAIQNSTVFLRSNVTESSDVYLPASGELGPHLRYLGASIAGHSAVEFSPALGLFPDVLSPGSTWASTSQFDESGAATYSYYFAALAPVKSTIIGPVSGSASLAAIGNVSVAGAYPTGSVFQYGGVTYPAITLIVSGPFSVREGVIFVPTSVDLFGTAIQPWSGNETGTSSAQMSTLDLKLSSGHFTLVASSWRYDSNTANAAVAPTLEPSSSGLTPSVTGSNPVSSTVVQGEPENSAQVGRTTNCLTAGSGCPSVVGPSSPRSPLGLAIVVGSVATVGALVALAVVTRRRKVPPTVYPNAVLYPPGAASPLARPGAPAPPTAPSPPEDDPLDHLW